MAEQSIRIGVDLGGTKIEAIALGQKSEVLARRRVPTPEGNYDETVRAIVELIRTMEKALKARGTVGVGIPGAISLATGRVKNANSTVLIGRRLDEDLSKALEREVRLSNDANCFAVSEAQDGAGKGAAVVFGVIIGTGTGAGIVVEGKILTGPNAIAGEWGHNPLPWPRPEEIPGPRCYCGKNGCIETFLSGPGMATDFLKSSGKSLEAPDIVRLAARGEIAAEACVKRYEDRMARGLAHVINVLDPDIIVLGGGLSNMKRLYRNVPRLWKDYVFSDRVDTRLVPPVHGESSGVRAAAWLWGLP